MKVRIVACGVFQSALSNLNFSDRFPEVELEFLPPYLHNYPFEIRNQLTGVIERAHLNGQPVICLYGKCFPEIDGFLKERRVCRPRCDHCYEMLLGTRAFQRIVNEAPDSYFIEKELLLNFNEYCRKPLELDDPQMKDWFFERYQTLLYIRQPGDPDLQIRAKQIAKFLGLDLHVIQADYGDLADRLENEIKKTLT
jgi:hypothetical protein